MRRLCRAITCSAFYRGLFALNLVPAETLRGAPLNELHGHRILVEAREQ